MSIEIKFSKKQVPYEKAIVLLNKRVEEVKKRKNKELIWVLEHPLTYTGGVSFNQNEIVDKKINIIKTSRGGKITLHNPGQKIVYFVIDLNKRCRDIRKLITAIENTIIEFLMTFKIKAKKDKKNIGIWFKDKKIAAIGLRVSKWVAFHGFSINISNNLNDYHKIIPCGLDNKKITSIYLEKKIVPKNFDKNLVEILIRNINKI